MQMLILQIDCVIKYGTNHLQFNKQGIE